jgi:hypothetical protein
LIREYEPVADVDRYTLYPAIELDVLAFQDSSTLCWIVTPEPVAVSDAVLELLAMKERFAEAAPAAVGANVTEKGTLWPAARVTGNVSPATLKAELLEPTEDRVKPPPVAVTLPL